MVSPDSMMVGGRIPPHRESSDRVNDIAANFQAFRGFLMPFHVLCTDSGIGMSARAAYDIGGASGARESQ